MVPLYLYSSHALPNPMFLTMALPCGVHAGYVDAAKHMQSAVKYYNISVIYNRQNVCTALADFAIRASPVVQRL